jgi:ribosome recycling factor
MNMQDRIFKIAVLNDLIGLELAKIDIKNIVNSEAQSKLRNLKKSTSIFTKWCDETFRQDNVQEAFGDFCDQIDEVIEEHLKVLRQESEN